MTSMNEWINILTAAGMSKTRAPRTAEALVADEVKLIDNAKTIETKIQNGTSGYTYNGADKMYIKIFLEKGKAHEKSPITDTQ